MIDFKKEIKNILVKNKDLDLIEESYQKVSSTFFSFEQKSLFSKLTEDEYISNINYEKFIEIEDKMSKLSDKLKNIKEDINSLQLKKAGEVFNWVKLKTTFKNNKLNKRFPNFDFERYRELVNNPVLELKNFEGETIFYDRFLIEKIIALIHQMIFDEMDTKIVNVGTEGSGKSCFSSQLMLYFWWFLTEVKLIEYEFDVKKMFYSSLPAMMEAQDDQKDGDYFRFYVLDEGNELNRSNYREESNKIYKDMIRSERKMQRIEIINLPQIGELDRSIVETRTNIIFYSNMSTEKTTGTLKKGIIDMYVFPRNYKIYSPFHRKEISRNSVQLAFSKLLKDKNESYKGMPTDLIVHKFKVEGVWGFDKNEYDSYIKKENRNRRRRGVYTANNYVCYLITKFVPSIKHWGTIDPQEKGYHTLQKWFKGIQKRFDENPRLWEEFERSSEMKTK